MVNIGDEKQERRFYKRNITDFKAIFGRHPIHLCRVWRDLQTTSLVDALMSEDEARQPCSLRGFMIANNFLKTYNTLSHKSVVLVLSCHRRRVFSIPTLML